MKISDRDIDLDRWMSLAHDEGQHIYDAADLRGAMFDLIAPAKQVAYPGLPWSKTLEAFQLRPGELSIWGGINGHGKSLLLGQVILWNILEEPALIASMEMTPGQTLYRLAHQAMGGKPGIDTGMEFMEKVTGNLFLYDQLDSVAADRILAMVHYAAVEIGVQHIVIDSLTKCGITRDDYAAQTRFVDKLQWAAKRHKVHIHLVCHMRKGEDENKSPGKFDIRGAAEISDLADNVFVVHRNKAKESAKRAEEFGKGVTATQKEKLDQPDTWLTLAKNRHGGVEDCWGLWYHAPSMQFVSDRYGFAMPWPKVANVETSPMRAIA